MVENKSVVVFVFSFNHILCITHVEVFDKVCQVFDDHNNGNINSVLAVGNNNVKLLEMSMESYSTVQTLPHPKF